MPGWRSLPRPGTGSIEAAVVGRRVDGNSYRNSRPGSTFANGPYLVLSGKVPLSTSFVAFSRTDGTAPRVSIRHGRAQSLTLGRHMVSDEPMDPDGHHLAVGAEGRRCNPLPGGLYT
ncbi:MAG: hypothetical protein M3116_04845 [Actinomycetota bacterium]|nr:hypothetical protein [Actinomycetota bacterium]